MATRISDKYKISKAKLKKYRLFDGFIELDSQLYVDPFLLRKTDLPDFSNSFNIFIDHFKTLIKVLKEVKIQNDIFYKKAYNMLLFKEDKTIKLGYSVGSTGKGIGTSLAKQILETSLSITRAGIADPVFFELLPIFQENFGPDLISDMTCNLIKESILSYTDNIITNENIPYKIYTLNEKDYRITIDEIVFLPQDILRDLPVAYCFSDISTVVAHNKELRDRLNREIGSAIKLDNLGKHEIKSLFINIPETLTETINSYKQANKCNYDFVKDPKGLYNWDYDAAAFTEKYPYKIINKNISNIDELFETVLELCLQFKKLIEKNNMSILFMDNGKSRNEKYAQHLFYAVADSYCQANDVDISREPNAGPGPVDFKISKGYMNRVLVEIKYSNNSNILRGFQKQLPAYNEAEDVNRSIYLVIITNKESEIRKRLETERNQALKNDKAVPYLIFVDATKKMSASKRK